MKKALALVLAVAMIASALVLTGCGKDGGKDGGKDSEKTYIIYSDNAFAPFEYLDTDTNEYVGVDMEIMKAVAEAQGIK